MLIRHGHRRAEVLRYPLRQFYLHAMLVAKGQQYAMGQQAQAVRMGCNAGEDDFSTFLKQVYGDG